MTDERTTSHPTSALDAGHRCYRVAKCLPQEIRCGKSLSFRKWPQAACRERLGH